MLKSKIRFVLLAVLMALAVAAPATNISRAQDTSSACLPGLDADTCALFQAAAANVSQLDKFNMAYDVALKTVGTTSDVDVTVHGSGPIDVSGIAAAASSGTAMSDPAALLKDLKLQQTLDASMTSAGSTMGGKFEFRIVDGILYYMGDMASNGKWMKLDLTKALASASSQLGAMQGQMGGTNGAASAVTDPEFLALFSDPSEFFTTDVADGAEVDGVTTTSVTLNINLKALITKVFSDEARPTLIKILKAQGQEVDEQQLAQMGALLNAVEPTLDATKLSVSWLIDPEAEQFRGFSLNFSTTVDKSTVALMGAGTDEIQANFSLDVKLSAIGEDVTVEPVADAVEADMGN